MKKRSLPLLAVALLASGCGSSSSSSSTSKNAASTSANCPHSPVRWAIEPYDAGPALQAAYKSLATDLQAKLGCPVQLIVSDSYVAEIEAMRAGNLEIGEFGPLGYILAHRLASATPVVAFGDTGGKPDVYTAGIWVAKKSPIKSLAQLKGKTVALSSTTSTSGGLYPISALIKAGYKCTPTGCQGITIKFAGSHTATLLALTHGSVDAAEINSQQQSSATAAHQFNAANYRQIWKSTPIVNDPIAVRGSLATTFQDKVKQAFLSLSAAQTSTVDKELGTASNGPMVPATDALYNDVRAVADALHLNTKDLG